MYELISVITQNGSIIENIPVDFHIPEDLKRFKQITINQIVIMGRKTFDSLGGQLKNRINIVITRNNNYQNSINLFFCKLEELDKTIQSLNSLKMKIFIIGGSEIYNILFNKCNKLHLTVIDKEINSTNKLSFDKINSEYKIIYKSELYYSIDEKCYYNYITYQKI